MREFASLVFTAALAALLGSAGVPSLGASPICALQVGQVEHAGGYVLYPAASLGATQAEAEADRREGGGGPEQRRTVPDASPCAPRAASGTGTHRPDARTPCWLLGFAGHPTTAPPART